MAKIRNKPYYNERKTTQVAALLLKHNKGRMNYVKLIKLIYNIDREALKRWKTPITFDDYFSLPRGQIVSNTLDKVEEEIPTRHSYWNDFIETHGVVAHLKNECNENALSRAEIELIEEIYEKYKLRDWHFMAEEHHNPNLFPEYIDPNGSSIKIETEHILEALGLSNEEIEDFESRMEERAFLETFA